MKKLTYLMAIISVQAMAATYTCEFNTTKPMLNSLVKKEFAREYSVLLKSKGFKNSGLLYSKNVREVETTKKLVEEFFEVCNTVGGTKQLSWKRAATLIVESRRDEVGPYFVAKFALGFDMPALLEINTSKSVASVGGW